MTSYHQIERRLPQPLSPWCRIFNWPQISDKCLKVAFLDRLALPCIWIHFWMRFWVFFSSQSVWKRPKRVEGGWFRPSNLGKRWHGFVSALISYFFSPRFQFQLEHWGPSNLGKPCICFVRRFIFVPSVGITFQQNTSWIGESQCMYCYLCSIFEFWSQNECMIFSGNG